MLIALQSLAAPINTSESPLSKEVKDATKRRNVCCLVAASLYQPQNRGTSQIQTTIGERRVVGGV
jgi:hypothetical protein